MRKLYVLGIAVLGLAMLPTDAKAWGRRNGGGCNGGSGGGCEGGYGGGGCGGGYGGGDYVSHYSRRQARLDRRASRWGGGGCNGDSAGYGCNGAGIGYYGGGCNGAGIGYYGGGCNGMGMGSGCSGYSIGYYGGGCTGSYGGGCTGSYGGGCNGGMGSGHYQWVPDHSNAPAPHADRSCTCPDCGADCKCDADGNCTCPKCHKAFRVKTGSKSNDSGQASSDVQNQMNVTSSFEGNDCGCPNCVGNGCTCGCQEEGAYVSNANVEGRRHHRRR